MKLPNALCYVIVGHNREEALMTCEEMFDEEVETIAKLYRTATFLAYLTGNERHEFLSILVDAYPEEAKDIASSIFDYLQDKEAMNEL